MTQNLASGKVGSQRYANNDALKSCPALDDIQTIQQDQRIAEETQGYSLSTNEGNPDSLNSSLSIINAGNVSNYDQFRAQTIQTYIANNSYLEVDAASTANNIILAPRKIANIVSPDGVNYSKTASLPFAFRDNLKFTFRATLTNTNSTQLQITGLAGMSGAVDIIDEAGVNLIGGEIVAGKFYDIILTGTSGTKKVILKSSAIDATATVKGIQLLKSNKNAIINGDFNIWQRGTSFASVAAVTFAADRFYYNKSGAMVHDISRSTDVPTFAQAGRLFNYSMKVDCQTVDSSIGATDLCIIETPIEGYNFLPLAQKTMTLSFWVKATKTGVYCIYLANSNNDRSYVAECTINASNTWEFKTITIAASPSAGTWNYTNGVGLRAGFVLAAGSNNQTTKDTWQSGAYFATANQVNACDSTSNDFYLCGIQLEAGSVATPFENRTIQEELALCQRYFEKSYDLDVSPATISTVGANCFTNQNTQANRFYSTFKVTKRTTPTISSYSPTTGAIGKLKGSSADFNSSISDVGHNSFTISPDVTTILQVLYYHWVASSEL